MFKIVTIAIIMFASTAYANNDDDALKLDAAKRYLSAKPMIVEVINNISEDMPPEQAADFKSFMLKHLNMARIEKTMQDALVKHYTLNELNAMADFYGSEAGKSAIKKSDAYTAEIMPGILLEVREALTHLKK